MLKLSLILLLSITLSCLARPQLRVNTDNYYRPQLLFKVLTEGSPFLANLPKGYSLPNQDNMESDALNEFAQAVAESSGNPIDFIDSYKKSSENILTFGFKLKGSTTIETIMLGDSTEVMDHMSGFLDVRHKEFKFNIFSQEIRKGMKLGQAFTPGNFDFSKIQKQLHAGGSVSVASEQFNWSTKLNGLRDLLSVMTMYDSFIENQIKLMDAQGNIPLGTKPSLFKIEADDFVLKLSTTKNYITPLKVDPTMQHDDLLEAVDWHFRTLTNEYLSENFELVNIVDKYGFGLALDSNGDITIVYSFGGNKKMQPAKKLYDYYQDVAYVSQSGARFPYEPFRRQSPLEYVKIISNQIIDQVNYERVYSQSLRPIKYLDQKLYEVCQKEAERSANAGKLVEPTFSGISADAMFISISIVGKTTVKDFIFSNDKSVGTIAVFDNFSNVKPRFYQSTESFTSVFNGKQQENWKKFDSLGTGYSWNSKGDIFSITALSVRSK